MNSLNMLVMTTPLIVSSMCLTPVYAADPPVARALVTNVEQGGTRTLYFDLGKYQIATNSTGAEISIIATFGASYGTVGVAPDGKSFSYTNNGSGLGTNDVFNYVVSDIHGSATNTVSVTILSPQYPTLYTSTALWTYGIPGVVYELQNNTTPGPTGWVPVATNSASSSGVVTFILTSPSGFYRTRYVSE